MPNFRQLTPDEINQEAIQETTPPWEILGALYGGGVLARTGLSGIAKALAKRRALTPISAPGKLAEMANQGQITRPWVGIKSALSKEGTQPLQVPKSYTNPRTINLPPTAEELKKLLEDLGGSYTGP